MKDEFELGRKGKHNLINYPPVNVLFVHIVKIYTMQAITDGLGVEVPHCEVDKAGVLDTVSTICLRQWTKG